MRTQRARTGSWLATAAALVASLSMSHCAENKGACNPPCSTPLTCCGGICANLQTDNQNCGECGNECEPGATCTAGICPDVCGSEVCIVGETCCLDECVDTQSDGRHCGECDNACDDGWDCIEGTCEHTECDPPCDTGETCCSIPGGDPICADLDSSEQHCGVCRHECDTEESCSDGLCTLTPCEPPCGGDPERCCGGICVNTDTDMDNCGFCGNVCDPLRADECYGGECVCNRGPDCTSSQECCPSVGCRNVAADPNNCGECGNVCDTGLTCTDGECLCGGVECEDGYSCCSGSCRDLSSDPFHCGECGHPCGTNAPTCVDGGCKCGDDPPCSTLCGYWACDSYLPPGPYDDCQACCPDLGGCISMSDTDCGTCGHACLTGQRCEPVLYGMPPPFGGYCLFECVGTGPDGYSDIDWDLFDLTDPGTDLDLDPGTD